MGDSAEIDDAGEARHGVAAAQCVAAAEVRNRVRVLGSARMAFGGLTVIEHDAPPGVVGSQRQRTRCSRPMHFGRMHQTALRRQCDLPVASQEVVLRHRQHPVDSHQHALEAGKVACAGDGQRDDSRRDRRRPQHHGVAGLGQLSHGRRTCRMDEFSDGAGHSDSLAHGDCHAGAIGVDEDGVRRRRVAVTGFVLQEIAVQAGEHARNHPLCRHALAHQRAGCARPLDGEDAGDGGLPLHRDGRAGGCADKHGTQEMTALMKHGGRVR